MKSYDTLVEALNDLKAQGYTTDFNIVFDKLVCSKKQMELMPDQFEIVDFFRFEGETNPSDEDTLYVIESKDGRVKGVLTEAFGTYSDSISEELLKKLSIHKELP